MLGALYAALGALTFALNNATMRRGVVSGTVMQGMAITVPIGAFSFLVMTAVSGSLSELLVFPVISVAWLVGQGMVHFVVGRFCNYKANQLMGVNLSAPVVQLQVPVALLLAVATMHETFTVFQAFGCALMLSGSFATQRSSIGKPAEKETPLPDAMPFPEVPTQEELRKPIFVPRLFSGYLFGLGAALCYGASPLMARQAFLHAPHTSTSAGGCIAYGSATLLFALTFLRPEAWRDVRGMKGENVGWFLSSAVLVAISQAFVYASLSVAPLMVVTPILQLSLIFRLLLSQWLNREHEVLNFNVITGAVTAVLGSILVSLNTDYLVTAIDLPDALGHLLSYRLAGYR